MAYTFTGASFDDTGAILPTWSATEAGDLAVLTVASRSGDTISNVPSGFTLVESLNHKSGDTTYRMEYALFVRECDGNESGSVEITDADFAMLAVFAKGVGDDALDLANLALASDSTDEADEGGVYSTFSSGAHSTVADARYLEVGVAWVKVDAVNQTVASYDQDLTEVAEGGPANTNAMVCSIGFEDDASVSGTPALTATMDNSGQRATIIAYLLIPLDGGGGGDPDPTPQRMMMGVGT